MRETFLCAKYDYKMDIAVKQEEAFQDGKEAGITEGISLGTHQKAIEDARSFYANGVSIDLISKSLNMTPEQVNEIVSQATLRNRE